MLRECLQQPVNNWCFPGQTEGFQVEPQGFVKPQTLKAEGATERKQKEKAAGTEAAQAKLLVFLSPLLLVNLLLLGQRRLMDLAEEWYSLVIPNKSLTLALSTLAKLLSRPLTSQNLLHATWQCFPLEHREGLLKPASLSGSTDKYHRKRQEYYVSWSSAGTGRDFL